jgi:alpha-tubulin suppressor-like RCC1 family protein
MGANDPYRQLGRDDSVFSFGTLEWINYVTAIRRISAGADHTCAITDGSIKCWGRNTWGQTGHAPGAAACSTGGCLPTTLPDVGVAAYVELGLGYDHSCAISDTEGLYCWGAAGNGRLGTGDMTDTRFPMLVDPGPGWRAVDGGRTHTCAINKGELYCWGDNGLGQLGDGTRIQRTVPGRVGTDADWIAISAGNDFTCGVRSGGKLYCWGENGFGQLGIALASGATSPVRVCFP